jgi:hypothetical protein
MVPCLNSIRWRAPATTLPSGSFVERWHCTTVHELRKNYVIQLLHHEFSIVPYRWVYGIFWRSCEAEKDHSPHLILLSEPRAIPGSWGSSRCTRVQGYLGRGDTGQKSAWLFSPHTTRNAKILVFHYIAHIFLRKPHRNISNSLLPPLSLSESLIMVVVEV